MAEEYNLSDVIKNPVSSDTILSYSSNSVSAERFRAFKKGQVPFEDALYLENLTIEAARKDLIYFIKLQAKKNERCLLIIHGNDSQGNKPPLIKNMVNVWLSQFREVLAFHTAQAKDGGTEAVYVLLKKEQDDLPAHLPVGRRNDSFLVAETKAMERNRRLAEQQGERQLASVKARDHSLEDTVQHGPEGELQNSILQHPELNSQRFDGIDTNLNPEPPLNSDARREFDNEKREQDKEKQLRLGNMPKFSSAPTPKGP